MIWNVPNDLNHTYTYLFPSINGNGIGFSYRYLNYVCESVTQVHVFLIQKQLVI